MCVSVTACLWTTDNSKKQKCAWSWQLARELQIQWRHMLLFHSIAITQYVAFGVSHWHWSLLKEDNLSLGDFFGHVQYTPKPVDGFVFRRPLGQVPPKMVFLRMVCGSQPEPLLEWMLCDCLPAAKYGNCMQGNCFLRILVLYIKSIGATFLETLLRLSLLSCPELQYLLCCG